MDHQQASCKDIMKENNIWVQTDLHFTLNGNKEQRDDSLNSASWAIDYGSYKGKGKVHPRTGHEGPDREHRYSSTLSLTSALHGVRGQRQAPAALPPGKRPGTHCIGGWVGPRAGLDGCGKSRPHRDSIPGPSSL